jgi:transposase
MKYIPRKRGSTQTPLPAGFSAACALWQSGEIPAREAALRLNVTLNQFTYLAQREGVRKPQPSLQAAQTAHPKHFAQVLEQWRTHEISAAAAARALGVSLSTFYHWTALKGITPNDRKRVREAQFEMTFAQWLNKKLDTKLAAAAFGVNKDRFLELVRRRHPDAQKQKTALPKLFFQLCERWQRGEIDAKTAAQALHIHPQTFSVWANRNGYSVAKYTKNQRETQFETVFVKWHSKELNTKQAAKAFNSSPQNFLEWVKQRHPEASPNKSARSHPNHVKFPHYFAAYRQKRITGDQAAKALGVSRQTFLKWVKRHEAALHKENECA